MPGGKRLLKEAGKKGVKPACRHGSSGNAIRSLQNHIKTGIRKRGGDFVPEVVAASIRAAIDGKIIDRAFALTNARQICNELTINEKLIDKLENLL
ncbi:MAG: hypothetical protein V1493_00720 [Candidatus Diapherotrites archaeon]